MTRHKSWRILSVFLVVVMAIGMYGTIPQQKTYAEEPDIIPVSDSTAEWADVQNIVGKYKGEWNDSTYPGLITNRVPNTALLGNGDVGIASGGDTTSKKYYISKGDFWRFKGSPVPIGGLQIAPVAQTEPAPVSLIQGKTATANSSHESFPPSRAVSGDWGAGYEGWVTSNDRTNGAASTANPWILTINIGEEITFNQYIVRHDGAARPAETANNTKEFAVQISSNGTDWTEVDKVTGNTASTTDKVLGQDYKARYVRLVVYKGIQSDTAANPRARIGQFELYYKASAASVNLALNKPATASTVHESFTADRAVNGLWTSQQLTGNSADRYEGWVSAVQVGSVPWLRIDLGQPTAFNHFIVKFDEASRVSTSGDNTAKKTAKEFGIQTSNDGSTWTTVASITGNTAHTVDKYLENEVTARYVRVWLTVPNQQSDSDTINNPRGCIGQFELYNGTGPGEGAAVVDLARGKTTTASAQLNANLGPSRATDGVFVLGNNNNREGWASGSTAPQWLQVDLGAATTFNKYFVAHDGAVRNNSANNPKHFQILGSNNGTDWTVIDDVDNNTADYNEVILDAPVTFRYVRFNVLYGQQNELGMARCGAFRLYYQPDLLQDVNGVVDADGYTCYTLPKDWKIGSMLLNTGAGNPSDVLLQFSKDGLKWKTAVSVPTLTNNVVREFGPFTAKYWRVKASAGAASLRLFASDKAETVTSSLHEVEDILNAELRTDFMYDDDQLAMRSFMAATKNILVTEVKSNNDYPVEVKAGLWSASNNAGTFPFTATAKTDSIAVSRTANPGSANSEVQAQPYYTKATLESKVIGANVTTTRTSNSEASMNFTIAPGETIYVVTAIGGGGRVYQRVGNAQGPLWDGAIEPDVQATQLLSGITNAADIKTLEDAHDAWWKNYWMQSYVKLDTSDAKMDTILKYYYGAQYQLGSGVREGNVAAGLYGIWHTTDTPSWNSDFHLNYNFISTYYGVSSSNRPELNLPPVKALLDYAAQQGFWNSTSTSVVQRINSQFVNYKIGKGDIGATGGIPGGLLMPVGIGPFGFDLDLSFHSEALNAGFSIYPMIEYYNFTQNDEWLRNSGVYEYIKGCIKFYQAWLEEKPGKYADQGKYLLYAGYNEGSWSIDPAVELAVIKVLLNNGIRFSEVLGVDAAERASWEETLAGLSPQPTITVSGNKVYALAALEWPGYTYGSNTNAWTTADDQWRVMSSPIPGDGNSIPLEAIIPGEVMGYYSDAETLRTAQNTIGLFDQRNQWGQINNFPKMFTQAVNIRYNPQTIVNKFAETITARIKPNLMIEDNTHGVEKAGAIEALNNMLLVSDQGVVKAFPNWVSNRDASFTRLREKGAFVVSATYDGSAQRVKYVDVTSEAGKALTIAAPWDGGLRVVDQDGKDVAFTQGTAPNHADEITITFATEKGKSYRLTETDVDKSGLQSLYDTATAYYDGIKDDADEYASLSFKAFEDAIAAAKSALDDLTATQEDVDAALGTLTKARDKVGLKASSALIAALQIVVDSFAQFLEADYTPSSWAPFGKAFDDAKAILATPGGYSDADIDAVFDALIAAESGLVRSAIKTGLKMAIDYAENMLKPANIGKYIPASVANLEDVLSGAAIVYADADTTQTKVDKAQQDLMKAIGQMYEKGDKTGLQALVTLVSRYTQTSYTPASWTAFAKALDDARKVIANPNAIADSVNKAYATLSAATTGLTRKADVAALNTSIVLAQQIVSNIADYVPSTVIGLAEELAAAKAVAGNPDATQVQVNAAAAALNAKLLAARLKPDLSGLLSATARARAVEESLYTAASYKVLTTAVTGAEDVLRDAPEKVTQADVDGATQSVYSAIAALVPKTADIAGNDGKDVAKTVIPKGKVSKITASAKAKIVVKWAKAPAAAKVTGYQVQYRVKGSSKWTTKTVSAKSASLTIKNLKKNKQYQIRIRAYRTGSGTEDYGAWSAVKISKKIK